MSDKELKPTDVSSSTETQGEKLTSDVQFLILQILELREQMVDLTEKLNTAKALIKVKDDMIKYKGENYNAIQVKLTKAVQKQNEYQALYESRVKAIIVETKRRESLEYQLYTIKEELDSVRSQLKEAKQGLRRVTGSAGLPDALEACRVVIQIANETLKRLGEK